MQAAVVSSYDLPPRYETFAEPVAAEGETLVSITAAGLHPIVKALANGSHYGSTGVFPFVAGVDGVGRTADGSRVFFGVSRSPFGTFAERGLAAAWMCLPLPDGIEDAVAAGIANPGMSSWAAMGRGGFQPGENVLILGATGVAGQLAVQIARRRGASRVIAAGRNAAALEQLKSLGADAVVSLEQTDEALVEAFRQEIAPAGVDVVLDYLWGRPAECLLRALAQKGLTKAARRVRYVEIGDSAGKTIALAGATLRSSGLELLGSGFGSASLDQLRAALEEFFQVAARQPFHFQVKRVKLADVEQAWREKEDGVRIIFEP
jgi:NADPH:quinone reductase-like Zn-dependent oxidoreductase